MSYCHETKFVGFTTWSEHNLDYKQNEWGSDKASDGSDKASDGSSSLAPREVTAIMAFPVQTISSKIFKFASKITRDNLFLVYIIRWSPE